MLEKNLIAVINRSLVNTGYGLIDYVLHGDIRRKVLEIFVDSEKPVNLDDLGEINKKLWEEINNKDEYKNISKIVVSSPGVDRPIKYLWQLKKHIGRTVSVKDTTSNIYVGKLTKVNETGEELTIVVRDKKNKTEVEKRFLFSSLQEVKVKVLF
ncbi:MAG: ribosome maturation factor RimP [Ignavibacteria bacterium]